MKSFSNVVLVVLAIAILTAVAQAETIYLTKQSGTRLEARDIDGGTLLSPTFASGDVTYGGVAVSPIDGNIYAARQSGEIEIYDPSDGSLLNASFADMEQTTRGICFDSTGNLYVATNDEYIAKITPGGDVTADWGSQNSVYAATDLEIYDGKLYAGIALNDGGVVSYDLLTGGSPTWVATSEWCEGVALGPDGTLYTSRSNGLVLEWDSSTTFTTLGNFGASVDVDYYDGKLYVGEWTDGNNGIHRYDLSTETWDTLANNPGMVRFMDPAVMVPEPSSFVLVAMGLLGLLAYAWRKRK